MSQTISALKKKQEALKLLHNEYARPAQLNTLSDYEDEIAYQESLLKNASLAEAQAINGVIKKLREEKEAFEKVQHIPVSIDKITTQKQLSEELNYYNELLETGNAAERMFAQRNINALNDLRKKWDNILADLTEPKELGVCESVEELEGAIGILEARAKRSGAEGAIAAARLKVGYERALGALRERIEIPGLAAEAARIEGLTGHEHKVAIRSIGVEKIREEIRNLQRLLSNAEISIGGEERAELEQLIATYRKWAQECSTSCGTVSDCLGGLGEMLGNIAGMTSKSAAAWLQWGAKVLDACSKALPAILAVTCAKAAESAAETPLVGWIMAGAAIAGVIAAFAGIPKFANGGIAYGPTVGVFGEYAGASSNPEVVAPLDRLRSLLGDAGGGGVGGGRVEFEISGRALRGVLRRVDEFERRTR